MSPWDLLFCIVILLSVSLIFGVVFTKFKQSPIIGYLLAGMLLSNQGIVNNNEQIKLISELGVALLLFSLGLEFSWKRLKSFGSNALLGGALQVAITALIISSILYLLKCELKESIALGAMISLSSTACVLRVLMDRGESDSSHGRNSIAILLLQDIAVLVHAIVLTLLAKSGNVEQATTEVFKTLAYLFALASLLYLVTKHLAVKILSKMHIAQNRELTTLLSVSIGLGSTWIAHRIGISPSLGAFISGMFLGSSIFAAQIRADISSIRIILLTLFFSSAGMIADPSWIISNIALVSISTAALLITKTIIIWIILSCIGQPTAVAFATGANLSQIGEFAFVLGAIGLGAGIIKPESYQLLISTAIVSLFLTPTIVGLSPKLGLWISKKLNSKFNPIIENNELNNPDIIIIGFGPSAKTAIKSILETDLVVKVIELNQIGINQAKKMGFKTLLGDARQIDVLEHAGVAHAKTILLTLPDYRTCSTVLALIRKLNKDARIIMRSRYHHNSEIFRTKGADIVIGDEEAVGNKLADALKL